MPHKDPEARRRANRDRMAKFRALHPYATRDKHLRRSYGITSAEWDELFASQGHVCAACGSSSSGRTSFGRQGCWHTDHNPKLKRGDPEFIRGILCHWCNLALHKRQTPGTLRALASYLEAATCA